VEKSINASIISSFIPNGILPSENVIGLLLITIDCYCGYVVEKLWRSSGEVVDKLWRLLVSLPIVENL